MHAVTVQNVFVFYIYSILQLLMTNGPCLKDDLLMFQFISGQSLCSGPVATPGVCSARALETGTVIE